VSDPLEEFRKKYEADDNEWWRLSAGEKQRLFEEALDRITEMEAELEREIEGSLKANDINNQRIIKADARIAYLEAENEAGKQAFRNSEARIAELEAELAEQREDFARQSQEDSDRSERYEARIAELEAELVAEKELRDYHGTEAASLRIERDRYKAVVEAAQGCQHYHSARCGKWNGGRDCSCESRHLARALAQLEEEA
jgi:multidrug efflux pump subunit AcrA (membrane-fusion protein)